MSNALDIRGTWLLRETLSALDTCRVLVHQGGSRTTKSYSIAQAEAIWLHTLPGIQIDVVRKRYTDLRDTVEKEFFRILEKHGLYNVDWHNKTENIYTVPRTGSTITFSGLMYASGKPNDALKGRSRDILHWNEPTDGTEEDWRQLIMRTSRLAILDYNPDYSHHWIYTDVLTRDDCKLVVSTYRDGEGVVPKGQTEEIKRMVPTYRHRTTGEEVKDWDMQLTALLDADEALRDDWDQISGDTNAWRVYGLGERGAALGTIYPNWISLDEWPEGVSHVYGGDFGFTRPAACVKVGFQDIAPEPRLLWEEVLYETELTNDKLAARILERSPDAATVPSYWDAAEPKSIRELRDAGLNAWPCNKKTTVREQVKWVKKHTLAVCGSSPNLKREIRTYKWRTDREGKPMDEPVDANNHAMDGGRYGGYSRWGESEPTPSATTAPVARRTDSLTRSTRPHRLAGL